MKSVAAFLCFSLIGFLIGNRSNRDAGSEDGDPGPLAITFQGDGSELSSDEISQNLSAMPPGGRYSRAQLLEWMAGDDFRLLQGAMREWVRTDKDGSGLRALHKAGYTTEAWSALGVWGEKNPLEAARIAFDWPPGDRVENTVFESLIARSITDLLISGSDSVIEIANRYSPRSRNNSFAPLQIDGEKWSTKKVRDTLDLVQQFESTWQRYGFAEALVKKLGETDPESALQWCDENMSVSHRISIRDDILESLLKKDSAKAVEFVDSMEDPHDREQWAELLVWKMHSASDKSHIQNWLRKQDREAMAPPHFSPFVDNYSKFLGEEFSWMDGETGNSFEPLFKDWPIETPDQAKGWISGLISSSRKALPDEDSFEQVQSALKLLDESGEEISPAAVRNLVKAFTKNDPSKAMQFASELPEHLTIEAADTALNSWFNTSPIDAREYVEAIPDGEFRRYAVERLAKNWLSMDPEPAIKWVNRMPRGIDKDIGRREIATTYQYRNPQRAFAQANAIDHAVIRDEMLESCLLYTSPSPRDRG